MGTLFVFNHSTYACRASRDMKHSFYIHFGKKPQIQSYGDTNNSTILPQTIDNCNQNAGKFIMLTKGVFSPTLVSDVADISLDGQIPSNNICKIQNPIFLKPLNFEDKRSLVKKQHDFLNKCTFISVAELNHRPLRYNQNQKFCKITKTGESMAQMEGDFCFLNISPNYNLAVTLSIKPECISAEKYKEFNLPFGDLEASLNTYVVADASGMSTDADPIGSSRYRMTFQPPKSIVPLADDNGEFGPKFPLTYMAEVNMGDLQFKPSGNQRFTLDMYMSVDNMGKTQCSKEGFCSSPTSFNIPVAASVELFQTNKINGKRLKKYVAGWTMANTAQGSWKGLVRMPQQIIENYGLKKGKQLQMVVTMMDPFEDYYLYIAQAQQFLINLKGMNGVVGLDSLPTLQSLTNLVGIPSLAGLPTITSKDLNSSIDDSIAYFKKLGHTRSWPTYYSKLCDPSHAKCYQAGKQKFWNRFVTDFTLGDIDSTGAFSLKDVHLIKETPDHVVMSSQLSSLPRYTCEM